VKEMLGTRKAPGIAGGWVLTEAEEELDYAHLGDRGRQQPLDLPDVSEVEVVRYFTGLSYESHGVDNGFYPLGSCTMKYNPRRSERLAGLDGFRAIHPLQPEEDIQGVLQLLFEVQQYLAELTGMDAVSLQPAAGAHGELAGLLMIKKYFQEKGQRRQTILIADSAHGTNPSSATMAGFTCRIVPTTDAGLLDVGVLRREMTDTVAGLMLTNPSTLGLFERNTATIATIVHEKGGLLYFDGANLNALMGIIRPGDMGFDVVHVNVHKTLGAPHGGGGPGAGPVGVKKPLDRYLPIPFVKRDPVDGRYSLDTDRPLSVGRMKLHFGHVGVLIKAYCYLLSMGPEGLRQAAEDAVLNANYVQHHLREILPPVFDVPCMHECLLSGAQLPVDSYSFVKRLIDYGIHPPTLVGAGCVYFPSVLKEAMLIEPTETETKDSLDGFIAMMRRTYDEATRDAVFAKQAPHLGRTRKIPQNARALAEWSADSFSNPGHVKREGVTG
jgi:glycine cleavage system protein P-like pyridoxal-binding family